METVPEHRRILDTFPAIYRNLLPAFFEQRVPEENLATCHACAMCTGDRAGPALGTASFNLGTKCCTFHPALPNYLVGAILADEGEDMAAGRERVRAQIRAGADCWPLGLTVPRVHAVLYDRKAPDAFGTSTALLCPYFQEGQYSCTIWSHRNSTCSTWFCKHVKGQDGREFWMAVKDYVATLEGLLPSHFAHELGVDPALTPLPDPTVALTRHHLEGTVDPSAHSDAWGAWRGREEAFYLECHRLAGELDRDAVSAIIGTLRQRQQQPRLERSYRQMMAPVLPDPLLRNPALTVFPQPDGRRLVSSVAGSYSLGAEMLELLWAFDGVRRNAEVGELLRREHGTELSPALLTGLYQKRLLVAPPA
jgi:hypothetical protein